VSPWAEEAEGHEPMELWTVVRYLHVLALVFFVGGQLMLAVAVTPAIRRLGDDAAMTLIARRFGLGSGVALIVLIATGTAMAEHFAAWSAGVLQAKLGLVVLVFALLGLHVVAPRSRALSLSVLAASLGIVYLGVELAHG
jgi:uncharacterized membrane protein